MYLLFFVLYLFFHRLLFFFTSSPAWAFSRTCIAALSVRVSWATRPAGTFYRDLLGSREAPPYRPRANFNRKSGNRSEVLRVHPKQQLFVRWYFHLNQVQIPPAQHRQNNKTKQERKTAITHSKTKWLVFNLEESLDFHKEDRSGCLGTWSWCVCCIE